MSGSILTFGTQWLGQLPDDWSQMRARYLFRERKQNSSPDDTHLTPSQKHAVLPQSEYMKLTGNRVVLNLTGSDNMKHVESGDFVIHLRSFQGGIEYSQYTGKVSNAYTVLQPKETVVPDFFRHVLKSYGFISELSKTTDQLRDGQSIKFSQLDLLEFPLPSPEIQQKIADFLDTETAQIDNLIAKQERLLELLEEKRRATITHAVTRGLDLNVELKETNTPWLDKVPKNWKLVPIKSVAQINNGGDYKDIEVMDGGYPVIGSGGEFARASKYAYDGKSVLFGRKGTIDKPLYFEGKFWTVDTMFWSKIDEKKIAPKFLYFSALAIPYDFYQTKTALPSMTQSNLLNHQIVIPNLSEQQSIVDSLEAFENKTNELKQKIQTQITLLRERRTSLISHAVTGKVMI